MRARPVLGLLIGACYLAGCRGSEPRARTEEAAAPLARTESIVGRSADGAREALADAMARARDSALERRMRMVPLRADPSQGSDAFGNPVHECTLTFRLEPDPSLEAGSTASPTDAAFEQRMRNLVEDGVLTIEEYARLMQRAKE